MSDPPRPTFRSIVMRTLRVWGAAFIPLTLTTVVLIYANQLFAWRLDAFYLSLRIDPLAAWAIRFFGGWGFNMVSGGVAAVVLIHVGLAALGHQTEGRLGARAFARHALPITVIYVILSPGDVAADLFPPQPYLAIGFVWSLLTALFICSDVTRVAENAGVRASLGRSFVLLRPHLWLVLALTVLWEGVAWGVFLIQNPLFLDQGVLNNEPVTRWVTQPLMRAGAYLFGMLGSIVLYADLKRSAEDVTARVFD